ncbi:ABC transporter permease [Marinifilum fragile]|uniref:ABC transporter permease n=1 Tax=Marinifilum fragile TaxID=570161 RepID=UPI002AA88C5E|nr:ABC transporter permease [Marinifilum fragile]
MLWHNIKLSFRGLLKEKLNSTINIVGLAIGMAAVLLISIYVQHELSYDKHNTKHDRIFRILTKVIQEEKEEILPICLRLTGDNFARHIPEIAEVTEVYNLNYLNLKIADKKFRGIKALCVDTNFHKVFTLEKLSSANPNKLFSTPNSAVINRSTAKKLFNTTDAVGKEFESMGKTFTIASVVEDIPLTSHYDFDVLIPFTASEYMNNMKSLEYLCYALLKTEINTHKALDKINRLYNEKLNDRFGVYNLKVESLTQKLTDIHLKSNYETHLKPQGKINSIYIQIILAALILVIAIINFINILVVQYDSKLSEIGLQKAIGATRFGVIKRIFVLTLIMVLFAILLGIIISEILLPFFSDLMNRNLSINYFGNPILYLGIPLLAILVGILSGLYPSFIISKYSPASIIKGNTKSNHKTNKLSQALVVFQFTISMVLIASVIIVQMQIKFMKESNLGFEPDKVIAINNLSGKQAQSYESIKQELLNNPNIADVSASSHLPGGGCSGQGLKMANTSDEATKLINEYRVAPGYFELLGIQFIAGSAFDDFSKADEKSIILNEKALELLNIKDAVGKDVIFHDTIYSIKGVVKDFHYASMSEEIQPLMFSYSKRVDNILIKAKHHQYSSVLDDIKRIITQFDEGRAINYELIDDICRNRYLKEEQEESLAISSSILSILLALLGLYALTLFIIQRRTKEIGIRKVAGASIPQIIRLLFSTYAKWLLIAFVISIPSVWFIMHVWLENFAYKVQIGVLPFLISGIITTLFALLTVSVQTWKAANQNPIESLRYE